MTPVPQRGVNRPDHWGLTLQSDYNYCDLITTPPHPPPILADEVLSANGAASGADAASLGAQADTTSRTAVPSAVRVKLTSSTSARISGIPRPRS